MTPPNAIARRRFLAVTATLAGTAPVLAACGSKHAAHNSATQNAKTKLPTYVPYNAIKPDFPANAAGAMPAYFSFPRSPKRAVTSPPAAGLDKVTLLTNTYTPPPPGMGSNQFWQQINKRIGATFALSLTPADSYGAKMATVTASGDVPDLVSLGGINIPHQPQVLATLFADLSEYLAGDAVKDYPFLANMATRPWTYTVANGGIYAVPQPRAVSGKATFYRTDLVTAAGANPNPASYDEFLALLRAVNNPKKNVWAISAYGPFVLSIVQEMLGVPNTWSVKNGEFVSAYSDERTKEALSKVASMFREGLIHPDTFSPTSNARQLFLQGRTVMLNDGYAAWDLLANQLSDNVGALVEPKSDGGGDAPKYAGAAVQAITAVKKGLGASKTKKILEVLNWLAAPIGTEEYLVRKFGVEGHDFTWKSGVPTLTTTGANETQMALQYITDAPTVIGPGPKSRVTAQHDWHVRVTKNLVYNPAEGLFSDSNSSAGPTISKNITDVQAAIMQGHKPVSSWDDAVKQWRSGGGDAIAREYAKAYHK